MSSKYLEPAKKIKEILAQEAGDVKSLSRGMNVPMWWLARTLNTLKNAAYTTNDRHGTLVVGITGLAGSGKDTSIRAFDTIEDKSFLTNESPAEAGAEAFTLCKEFQFKHLALADPIKEIAEVVGFSKDQVHNQVKKNIEDKFWGITPRKFMQMCGTEMFREVWRDDVWVKICQKRIQDFKKSIVHKEGQFGVCFVTDIRFPNEVEMIRSEGGVVARITRDGVLQLQHPSETQIKDLDVDYDIVNDASSPEEWSVVFITALCKFFNERAYAY